MVVFLALLSGTASLSTSYAPRSRPTIKAVEQVEGLCCSQELKLWKKDAHDALVSVVRELGDFNDPAEKRLSHAQSVL